MTNEQFEELVRRREAEATANPAAYRNKILWFGVLGYGYILLLLVGTLGLLGLLVVLLFVARNIGTFALKGIIALGLFAIVVVRALWVTFPKPEGIVLSETDAPELWATVNRLREKMSAPPYHQILLTSDYNASVVQRPLLGIFGWQQNYLTVGLPLLYTMTKEQVDSVIAHEMGHLRGGHGKFGTWVYRVNATWGQLLERLEEGGGANALVSGFFKWYAPQFAAYSFPLRRQDEYEADRAAAENVGRKPAADALALISVWEGYLSRTYWKPFYRTVHDSPSPPTNPFTGLIAHPLAPALDGDGRGEAERSLSDALREETTFADSHPALSDRLKSLGGEVSLPHTAPATADTALTAYFSRTATTLAKRLDAEFVEHLAPIWTEKYREAQEERKQLNALTARVQVGETFGPEEAWEYAHLTEEYRSEEAALPLYQALTEREDVRPVKNGLLTAGAMLQVGRLLMEKRDPAAVGYFQAAMETSPHVKSSALSMLYGFYRVTGDDEAARNVYIEALRHGDKKEAAAQERAEVLGKKVQYLPHGLTREQLAPVIAGLAAIERVGDVFLVRKEVKHFTDSPVFVIAISFKDKMLQFTSQAHIDQFARDVEASLKETLPDLLEMLPHGTEWNTVSLTGELKKHRDSFEEVEEAQILSAQR